MHSGVVNGASGNVHIDHAIAGWSAPGLSIGFEICFNSQSTRTTPVGPKWTHSYHWSISGTSPATVIAGDGTETTFTLSGGTYTPPSGVRDTLVRNADNTWTLTHKGGVQRSFNTAGRLTQIRDRNNNTVTLAYNAGGRVTTVTDTVGRVLTLGYDASNRLNNVTDFEGRVWTITYDGSNRPTTVTDPVLNSTAHTTLFGYGTNNNVTSITNRLGNVWSISYGTGNTFLGQTRPGGSSTSLYVYQVPDVLVTTALPLQDPVSYRARYTDTGGVQTYQNTDASGRLREVIDGDNNTTTMVRDTANQVTSVTTPGGRTTTYAYDANGDVTSVTDPTSRTTTYTYNSSDDLLSVTDPAGKVTSFTVNAAGNRLTSTDPTGNVTSYAYNTRGQTTSVTDPASKVWTTSYDSLGRATSSADPVGGTTTFTYSGTRVATRTDARGRTTNYSYDAWGRLTGIDYPTSADVSYTFDAESRLTQSVDGTGTRTYGYDNLNRRTSQTDPRGNTTATYTSRDQLATQVDASGRTLTYAYNGRGQLTSVSDPTSSTTYAYDNDGRMTGATHSNGTASLYTYDNAGRVTNLEHRRTSPVSTIVAFAATYNTAGRLATVTESPTSATTTYTYDDAGRVLTENRTGGSPYVSTYTYNSRGLRATSFRSEGGVTSHNGTYTYNDASRLTLVTQPGMANENFTWYADGTLQSLPGPGHTRNLEYDEEGRLTVLKRNATTAFEFGYGFDGGRRWTKELAADKWSWFPCGVACSAGELVEMTSTLAGVTWPTASTNLKGPGCASGVSRAGNQWVLKDLLGRPSWAVDSTATAVATAIFDADGVARYGTGAFNAAVIRDTYGSGNEDGLEGFLGARSMSLPPPPSGGCELRLATCLGAAATALKLCHKLAKEQLTKCLGVCVAVCVIFPPLCKKCILNCALRFGFTLLGCGIAFLVALDYCWDDYYKCKKERSTRAISEVETE